MKLDKQTLAHALENSVLLMTGLVLYDLHKLLYKFLKNKYPNRKVIHKSTTLISNMIMIFVLDLFYIMCLDKAFKISVV